MGKLLDEKLSEKFWTVPDFDLSKQYMIARKAVKGFPELEEELQDILHGEHERQKEFLEDMPDDFETNMLSLEMKLKYVLGEGQIFPQDVVNYVNLSRELMYETVVEADKGGRRAVKTRGNQSATE